jgi:hypothetical protein
MLYEQLRNDALASAHASPSPGLAVFLLKGMQAWMCVWSACLQSIGAEAASYPSNRPSGGGLVAERSAEHFNEQTCIAAGYREQITAILVQIILGQSQEVSK